MKNPHQITRDFEAALCEYTGAPFAVTTTSCTMALLLAVAWHFRDKPHGDNLSVVEIPKHTYIGVPMSILHAGGWPTFRDEQWVGWYQLKPLPVWDSARWLTSGMYGPAQRGQMVCLSFHWSKTLGVQQGGAILLDDPEADAWLRRARFDGRTEGVPVKDDAFKHPGWHCYMAPETAAQALMRMSLLPRTNAPLPWDEYPDISQLELFR